MPSKAIPNRPAVWFCSGILFPEFIEVYLKISQCQHHFVDLLFFAGAHPPSMHSETLLMHMGMYQDGLAKKWVLHMSWGALMVLGQVTTFRRRGWL